MEDCFNKYYCLSRVEYFLVSYEEEDKRKEAYNEAAETGKKAIEYNGLCRSRVKGICTECYYMKL